MEHIDEQASPFEQLLDGHISDDSVEDDDLSIDEESDRDPVAAADWEHITALPEEDEDDEDELPVVEEPEAPSALATLFEHHLDSEPEQEEPVEKTDVLPEELLQEATRDAEPDIYVAARRARQIAHSAHSLTEADIRDHYDEMSDVLAVGQHLAPGQKLGISYTLRSLPGFRGEAKAKIEEIINGQPVETSRLRGTLSWLGFSINYFLARLLEEKPPVKPGSEAQMKRVPLKDRDPDEVTALKHAQAKTAEVAHFEVDLYVWVRGRQADQKQIEQLADEVAEAMALTWRTTIQGLAFYKALPIEALQGYSGRKPAKPPHRVVLSAKELSLMAAVPSDETTPAGVDVDQARTRQLQPHKPRRIGDPLNPPPDLIPLGILNRGTSREMKVALANHLMNYHCYLTGGTGSGKSSLMKWLIHGMAKDDYSVVLIDPHGELALDVAEWLTEFVPERRDDIVIVDFSDHNFPVQINPLDISHPAQVDGAVASVMEMLGRELAKTSAPRAENFIYGALTALAEANLKLASPKLKANFTHIYQFFTNDQFRHRVVELSDKRAVHELFDPEVGGWDLLGDSDRGTIINVATRIIQKLSRQDSFEAVFRASENKLDLRKLIHENKLILIRLAPFGGASELGEFAGSLILPWIIRLLGEKDEQGRIVQTRCRVLVDEAPRIIGGEESVAISMLAEVRKWDLGLCFATQYPEQLSPAMQKAISQNVWTKIIMRQLDDAGAKAAALAIGDRSIVTGDDIKNQPKRHFFANTLDDDENPDIFSAHTLPLPPVRPTEAGEKALQDARERSRRASALPLATAKAEQAKQFDLMFAALEEAVAEDQGRQQRHDEFGIDWSADPASGSPWKRPA